MRQPTATALQIILAAVPEAQLRELILKLLLNGAMVAEEGSSFNSSVKTIDPTVAATGTTTPAPAARRKGWPRGKPRGPHKTATAANAVHRAALDRRNARLKAARAAARAKPNESNGSAAEITPAEVWAHAELLDQKAPYRAVARALDLNDQLVLDHFRRRTLPPSVSAAQAARFMETRPTG